MKQLCYYIHPSFSATYGSLAWGGVGGQQSKQRPSFSPVTSSNSHGRTVRHSQASCKDIEIYLACIYWVSLPIWTWLKNLKHEQCRKYRTVTPANAKKQINVF